MSFSSLGLSPELVRALSDKGHVEPTPIQSASIQHILDRRDVLAQAQTGSGKTAAFVLPLLQAFADRGEASIGQSGRPLLALLLVPTRELASQVADNIRSLSIYMSRRPKVVAIFGGVSANPQMLKLRGGADIAVATPGRLLDLIEQNALHLRNVETLVLDEADRMLDLGFQAELIRILELLPPTRQNLFFSATFPTAITALANDLLRSPVRVEIGSTDHDKLDITQRAIEVDPQRRTQLLRHLVQTEKWGQALVFVATKHAAEIVADKLRKAKIEAEPFHGELSQGKRSQVLMDLKSGAVSVVVATDVAARGIDIAGLPVVVNYDLPRSSVDYVHRIGRTGRAGLKGIAVSFISVDTDAHFKLIEKRNGLLVPREQIEGFKRTQVPTVNAADPQGTGGIKGSRPSKKDKLRANLESGQR